MRLSSAAIYTVPIGAVHPLSIQLLHTRHLP
jgi:hypothetical protein